MSTTARTTTIILLVSLVIAILLDELHSLYDRSHLEQYSDDNRTELRLEIRSELDELARQRTPWVLDQKTICDELDIRIEDLPSNRDKPAANLPGLKLCQRRCR